MWPHSPEWPQRPRSPHIDYYVGARHATVQWFAGTEETSRPSRCAHAISGRSRPGLYARPPREISDRLFVVRRTFRGEGSLPLPEFDPSMPSPSGSGLTLPTPEFPWRTRNYTPSSLNLVAATLVLKGPMVGANGASHVFSDDTVPDSACPTPVGNARLSFESVGGVKQTFAIRGYDVDLMNDAEENDEGSK